MESRFCTRGPNRFIWGIFRGVFFFSTSRLFGSSNLPKRYSNDLVVGEFFTTQGSFRSVHGSSINTFFIISRSRRPSCIGNNWRNISYMGSSRLIYRVCVPCSCWGKKRGYLAANCLIDRWRNMCFVDVGTYIYSKYHRWPLALLQRYHFSWLTSEFLKMKKKNYFNFFNIQFRIKSLHSLTYLNRPSPTMRILFINDKEVSPAYNGLTNACFWCWDHLLEKLTTRYQKITLVSYFIFRSNRKFVHFSICWLWS